MARLKWWSLIATLTWVYSGPAVDGFRIYRADSINGPFTLIQSVGPTVLSFVDPAGQRGNCWRVTAFNPTTESQPSNNGCLAHVTPGVPNLGVKE